MLPDNDLPEIFGMNEIADLACSLKDSSTILESLQLMQPRTVIAVSKSDSANSDNITS